MKPNRLIPLVPSAQSVLEFHAGSLWDDHIQRGNELYITEDEPYIFSDQHRTWLFLLPFVLITAFLWLHLMLKGITNLQYMGITGGYGLFFFNTLLILHLRRLKGPKSTLERFASVFALLFAMSLSGEEFIGLNYLPIFNHFQILGIAVLTVLLLKPSKSVMVIQPDISALCNVRKNARIQIIMSSAVLFFLSFLFSNFSYPNLASCICIITLLFFSFVRIGQPEPVVSIR